MTEKIRVFVATTEGPAEVQRLAEEDPSVQSVVCLQGRAVALPVSPDYDAFVRQPTGVIEAIFGHPAYRLDLAQAVTSGLSWQLGALVAHGLHAEGRLARRGEDAAAVLWATGEVDRDLQVLPVEHLAEKIRSSAEVFRALVHEDLPVTLCVPRDNRPDLNAVWTAATGLSLDQVDVLEVEDVAALFGRLSLAAPRVSLPQVPQRSAEEGKRPPRRARALALLAISLAGLIGLSYVVTELTAEVAPVSAVMKPVMGSHPQIELTALETRAPAGTTCAAVALGAAAPMEMEVPLARGGRRASTQLDALCRLRYRATNRGSAQDLWLVGVRAGESAEVLHTKTFFSALRLARDESESFEVVLPRQFDDVLAQSFAVVARPAASKAGTAFDDYADGLSEKLTAAAWRDWIAQLRAGGFTVEVAEHALAP